MLAQFISLHSRLDWDPGRVDCCLVLADWAMMLGHQDPAAHLRGTYADEAGFWRIAHEAGGLASLVGQCAAGAGSPCEVPARGVIAVIGSASNHKRQWGAIHDGSRWLVRTPDGFLPVRAAHLAMWRVTCRN